MPMKMLRLLSLAGCLAVNAPAAASITFEKTLVADTPAAFDKGVEFPLLGISKDKPTFVSARVFKWTQRADDMYVLEPTEDFTVYPQLVRMAPELRKVVRIKAAKPLPPGAELHYRIVLREFDRADGTDAPPEEQSTSAKMVVKPLVSIPMIVRGPKRLAQAPLEIVGVRAAPPPVAKAKTPGSAPTYIVTLRNPGEVYERVVAIAINQPYDKARTAMAYVLPGQSVDLPMNLKRGDKLDFQYVIGPDGKVDPAKHIDDRKVVSTVVS